MTTRIVYLAFVFEGDSLGSLENHFWWTLGSQGARNTEHPYRELKQTSLVRCMLVLGVFSEVMPYNLIFWG